MITWEGEDTQATTNGSQRLPGGDYMSTGWSLQELYAVIIWVSGGDQLVVRKSDHIETLLWRSTAAGWFYPGCRAVINFGDHLHPVPLTPNPSLI